MGPLKIFLARFNALPAVIQAAWWMTLSAFAYAASIGIAHHLTEHLPVFEVAFGRNVFAVAFMIPWLMRVGLNAMRTSHFRMHAVRGLFSAANVWFLFAALSVAPIADVSAITFMMPIVASILAVLFFREKTSLLQWVATLAGLPSSLQDQSMGSMPFFLRASSSSSGQADVEPFQS